MVCDFCLVIRTWCFTLSVLDWVVALVGEMTFSLFGEVGGVLIDVGIFGGVCIFGDLGSFGGEMGFFFACSSSV